LSLQSFDLLLWVKPMEKNKILLVEHDEDLVKIMSARLKIRNLKSEVALKVEPALEIVVNEKPDVMILDLKMLGIDCMKMIRYVKTTYPDVQVIILSHHFSIKDRMEAFLSGAYALLEKPVDIDKLICLIRQAYNER